MKINKISYIFFFISLSILTGGLSAQNLDSEKKETEAEGKKENKTEQNFLEMAVNYINEKNYVLAKRYLQQAESSGDERIFQESQLWKMYIEALDGNKNLESGLSSLQGDLNAKALYYISDGWQNYFEKNPEAKDIYALSMEYKEKLIVQFPETEWSTLASMQLVTININQKDFDKALYYLLKYMDNKKKRGTGADSFDDKAWFYMGQILENSKEYRDLHKAARAYYKVLENPQSLFYTLARNRISALEKFYHIVP